MSYKNIANLQILVKWFMMIGITFCVFSCFVDYYAMFSFSEKALHSTSNKHIVFSQNIMQTGVLLIAAGMMMWGLKHILIWLTSFSTANTRHNIMLNKLAFWKIPMMAFVRPTIMKIDANTCTVHIPLNRLTQNHLKSMYFGTLHIGADIAGGLMAMDQTARAKQKISLVFKDCKSDFLKRAEGDVLFTCNDGQKIAGQIAQTVASGERVNMPVTIIATVPDKFGDEPVATFELTLSLKCKK